jgi:hypothetical protein
MEKEGSTFINKTSHIENCETSAVGRALAMMGFEIKKSVASREEVANAKLNQDNGPDKKTTELLNLAAKKGFTIGQVKVKILNEFKKKELSQLTKTEYDKVIKDLEKVPDKTA